MNPGASAKSSEATSYIMGPYDMVIFGVIVIFSVAILGVCCHKDSLNDDDDDREEKRKF